MTLSARVLSFTAVLTIFMAVRTASAGENAPALDNRPGDEKRLKQCEAQLCNIILHKKAEGGPLHCDIGKAWGKAKIKSGAEKKAIDWSFGDARCHVDLKLDRSIIINALTAPKTTVKLPGHIVECEVGDSGEVKPVRVRLEPKLQFKDGKAEKIWINVRKIDAPAMLKGLIWTTAKLEDGIGIFHKEMIDDVNEFIHKKCAAKYRAGGKGAENDRGNSLADTKTK